MFHPNSLRAIRTLIAAMLVVVVSDNRALCDEFKGFELTLLQLNDVYETFTEDDHLPGGLARVTTLRKQLEDEGGNLVTILAGDFLSPSGVMLAEVDGSPLMGRNMIGVLNTVGLDYVTFGNHEFDLKEDQLRTCLTASEFTWIASNVIPTGKPFVFGRTPTEVLKHDIRKYTTQVDGKEYDVSVGFFAVTYDPKNGKKYAAFQDYIESAKEQVEELSKTCDIIIAITHLSQSGFFGDVSGYSLNGD